MTSFICAVDNADVEIGSFMQGCIESLEDFFFEQGLSPIVIDSRNLNSAHVKMNTEAFSSFVFAAYSHGSEDALTMASSPYVSIHHNIDSFINALFYSVSCLSGNVLGKSLIANGCRCFFGYRTIFSCWLGYREFVDCANFGLIQFVGGFSTVEVYHMMIKQYDLCIDNLFATDFFQAALLRENRDGLIRLGEDFTIGQM